MCAACGAGYYSPSGVSCLSTFPPSASPIPLSPSPFTQPQSFRVRATLTPRAVADLTASWPNAIQQVVRLARSARRRRQHARPARATASAPRTPRPAHAALATMALGLAPRWRAPVRRRPICCRWGGAPQTLTRCLFASALRPVFLNSCSLRSKHVQCVRWCDCVHGVPDWKHQHRWRLGLHV